ncbi:MAG: hypothetical protein ACK5KL_02475 [Dysgonomonas sp.]
MNKLFNICTLFALFAIMFVSCSPDDFGLGKKDVKPEDLVEGIAFKIEHDATNPNIVYLTSLMGAEYTPLWDHPQGRSQKQQVTLKMPFEGTYSVTFGVETRGGIVYGEPVTFTIDDFYAEFVNDEVWTMVSGGVGKSKTWYLDLDKEGISRKFLSPAYFFTSTYNWDALHTASGENYIDADVWDFTKAISPLAGEDGTALWYWLADWPGNSWITDAADFGTMTFDLIGGANITVDQAAYGLGSYTGTYMLSTEEHTIAFTDAYPLNFSSRNSEVLAATEFRILYLTEDAMQIMIVPSGTCLNYISEDYKNNWVPGEVEEEPPYNGNGNDDLTTTSSKKWKLSLETPYNWTNLSGEFLNNWSSPADYAAYDENLIKNIGMTMAKTGTSAGDYVFTDGGGNEISGTYTVDSKNNIIFDKDISFTVSGGISLATTSEKSLRIIRSTSDAFGNISDIWLGKRDASKEEYLVYHFKLSSSSSGGEEPGGTELSFDGSKVVFGDIEGNGKLRIEVYNAYGATAGNPPLGPGDIVFNNQLEITFTLGGITFNAGAPASYDASIYFANVDWNPSGNGPAVPVTGNGTYTVTFSGTSTTDANVVVVDITDLAKNIADMSALTATIDKVVVK